MSAVLNFLLANSSYVSLGALIMSVFFAGTFLQGERLRKQEVKDALEEIQNLTEQSMNRVEKINAILEKEDARLLSEIGVAYQELAALNEQERVKQAQLEETEQRNAELEAQNRRNRNRVRSSSGFIFDND